jgi:preprotein translocase subunit SecB
MRLSPLQLQKLVFTRIKVEAAKAFEKITPKDDATNFDFQGVTLITNLACGHAQGQEKNPRDFLVKLGIILNNKQGKPAPYLVDIEAAGYISLSEVIPKDDRSDIALVNGASLLYGAIRELVTHLTARAPLGLCQLPTMNFSDHARSKKPTLQPARKAAAKGKREK